MGSARKLFAANHALAELEQNYSCLPSFWGRAWLGRALPFCGALTNIVQRYSGFPSFFVNLSEVSSRPTAWVSCALQGSSVRLPRHLYDGLHFTSDGYLIMAEMIAQKVWHWL